MNTIPDFGFCISYTGCVALFLSVHLLCTAKYSCISFSDLNSSIFIILLYQLRLSKFCSIMGELIVYLNMVNTDYKVKVFTGIRPSGGLTIANAIGAVNPIVKIQEEE